jgi:hypothetical protein
MGERKYSYSIFVIGKTEGKRQRGKVKHRREDNIIW